MKLLTSTDVGKVVFRAASCLLSDHESNVSEPLSQFFVLLQELVI